MKNRKISIIVPVYNAEQYIDRCVNSIISQTYSNWELILVDDGSTDLSYRKCEAFIKKDERIVLLHQENSGVSIARNHGIHQATGELLCFLDADDWYDKNALSIMNENWDEETELLLFDYYESKNGCDNLKSLFRKEFDTRVNKGQNRYSKNYVMNAFAGNYKEYRINRPIVCSPCARAYDTSIIKNNQILFPQEISFSEDAFFNVLYCANISNIKYIKKSIYYYYYNITSVSKRDMEYKWEKLLKEFEHACEELTKHLQVNSTSNNAKCYEYYCFYLVRNLLWRLPFISNNELKKKGRLFCSQKAKECNLKDFDWMDRITIWMCRNGYYGCMEKAIQFGEKIKCLL